MICLYFFFFKQKTAYEMRISDWSSDVCSSDLVRGRAVAVDAVAGDVVRAVGVPVRIDARDLVAAHGAAAAVGAVRAARGGVGRDQRDRTVLRRRRPWPVPQSPHPDRGLGRGDRAARSEEHTSELQSLLRISYAVFCLKHKNAE